MIEVIEFIMANGGPTHAEEAPTRNNGSMRPFVRENGADIPSIVGHDGWPTMIMYHGITHPFVSPDIKKNIYQSWN